ncbi:TetR-like C-terminal domain-containing protein [Galbitalea sp. SE-J8]|uniref:TetR-like C-terminal domain-containing protein n=1 Tax=Galbitalea sp. SE-J8 TaxID=3054952 RepID=UPI00259CC858|nr:TetR-like C-terminal domain-containing protein [Galbitalea sp. SE-J8]MDM4762021.1 TetR-like C-terminal domain-containing protein [Galbitalea sp. SE-J8]
MSSNSGTPQPPRGRGRPRDPQLRDRILAAAARLAAEAGVDIGFDRIAQAAGASRTTLYRWWRTPEELLLDALLGSVHESITTDAGTPAIEGLREQMTLAADVLIDAPTGGPLRALAAGALSRRATHAAFAEHWLAPRRAAARELVARGIREGTIVDEDPELIIDALFAPIYHRAFFTDGPLDAAVIDALLRRVAR